MTAAPPAGQAPPAAVPAPSRLPFVCKVPRDEIRERTIRALSERGVNYTIDPHTGRAEVFNIALSGSEVLELLQRRAETNSQSTRSPHAATKKSVVAMNDADFAAAERNRAWRNHR